MYSQKQANSNNSSSNESNNNFHVCVRVRPTSSPSFENSGIVSGTKYIRDGPENSILLVQPNSTQDDKVFIYDEVFDSKTNTRDIFEKVVKPNLVGSLFKGFSHTVLVYGMTGSGKTFTMFGNNGGDSTTTNNNYASVPSASLTQSNLLNRDTPNNQDIENEVDGPLQNAEEEPSTAGESKGGLVSQIVKMVLASADQSQSKTKVKMSYLEIYNEQIRDLLSTEISTAENLMILEDPDRGVYCPLLSEKEITGIDQISHLIRQGNRRRVMASTKLNEFSSRSHAIIQLSMEIEVESNLRVTTLLTPKLYLVDLAGSERASATESKGVRLKEGSNINKSLLSLGNCITILSAPGEKSKKHVPYRDSKLTRLLKESLGGNAKTLLIACVTPAFRFVEETINTLKYAQRAKSIHKDVYENVKQIYNKIEKTEQMNSMQAELDHAQQLMQQQEQARLLEQNGGELPKINGELGELDLLDDPNLSEEEKVKRLRNLNNNNQQLTQEQILKTNSYKQHKETFAEKLKRLSDTFEDILFRSQELEFNVLEHKQSKESTEKIVHEIMDTINPAGLSQKEMKVRVDKVNMLNSVIKSNEDSIEKLEQEIIVNEHAKLSIKRELASLYELKFVEECQQLSNFQLYNTFEREKRRLHGTILQLQREQQQQKEIEEKKDAQIQNLRDEIEYIKRKANNTEAQLNEHFEQQRKRNKSQKASMNLRNSMYQPNTKTPRNASSVVQTPVQSKYMNIQTFVPSSNISAHAIRDRSQNNLRYSMYNAASMKTESNDNIRSSQFIHGTSAAPKSMTEININRQSTHQHTHTDHSPSLSEFEQFKRKEMIIEMQLGTANQNGSKNNLRASRVIPSSNSNNNNNNNNTDSSKTHSHNNSSSNIFNNRGSQNNLPSSSTAVSLSNFTPNKKQAAIIKSSFKSSFIDLAPDSQSVQFSNNQPGNNFLFTSYSQDTKSNDDSSGQSQASSNEQQYNLMQSTNSSSNNNNVYRFDLQNSQYMKTRDNLTDSHDLSQQQRSSFNGTEISGGAASRYSPASSTSAATTTGSSQNRQTSSNKYSSPKPTNKVKQPSLFLHAQNTTNQQANSNSGQIPSAGQAAHHSKTPSQVQFEAGVTYAGSSNPSPMTGIGQYKNYSPIIKSQFVDYPSSVQDNFMLDSVIQPDYMKNSQLKSQQQQQQQQQQQSHQNSDHYSLQKQQSPMQYQSSNPITNTNTTGTSAINANKGISKPSFNNYAQNNAMYGIIGNPSESQAIKNNIPQTQQQSYVPTAAISLNFNLK